MRSPLNPVVLKPVVVKAAIAALVRRHDVVPGVGQGRHRFAPGVGEFRKAVQQ